MRERTGARIENDRAVPASAGRQSRTSLGRLLATLRGADGLVDERGDGRPDELPGVCTRGLRPSRSGVAHPGRIGRRRRARDVRVAGRASASWSLQWRRVSARRRAGRPTCPWSPCGRSERDECAALGLDLLSEDPALSQRSGTRDATREAAFTDLVPLPGRPARDCSPSSPSTIRASRTRRPIGYVSASFSTRVSRRSFGAFLAELRVRVVVGRNVVYESDERTDRWHDTLARPRRSSLARDRAGRVAVATSTARDPRRRAHARCAARRLHVVAGVVRAPPRARQRVRARGARAAGADRAERRPPRGATTAEDVAASTVADLRADGNRDRRRSRAARRAGRACSRRPESRADESAPPIYRPRRRHRCRRGDTNGRGRRGRRAGRTTTSGIPAGRGPAETGCRMP